MKTTIKTLALFSMVMLGASAARADRIDVTIPNLTGGSVVTLIGTVDKIESPHEFMLRNDSGIIEVIMPAGQPLVLREDENVTVTGAVEKTLWGVLGSDIAATKVQPR